MDLHIIGERLGSCRKKLGMKQTDLAEKLGISRSYLSKIEAGIQNPSFEFLTNLVNLTNISLDWMLYGKGQMFQLPADHIINTLSPEGVERLTLLMTFPVEFRLRLWNILNEILLLVTPKQK